MRILLAEDEVTIAVTLKDALEEAGHVVEAVTDTAGALNALAESRPDVVLTDIRMAGEGGMEVLRRAKELDPDLPVIVMTGFATIDQAVEAMRLGAFDYIQKPFRNEAMVRKIDALSRVRKLEAENEELRAQLFSQKDFEGFVGNSPAMRAVFERIATVARTDATVLIEGESGTGKECAARALHRSSNRREGPFVAISCAALPESLLEAELFGYERGAFTDARKERRGRFELADKGTLFLDDIDDMPLSVQVKLLRVLQERTLERLGSEITRRVDIRIVAATKVPLRREVQEGRFREDLFYRINVVPLVLPPLRERAGDVPLLIQFLLERHGNRRFSLSPSTTAALERYAWPGNVRELENAIQRAVALVGDGRELRREHLLPPDPRWRGANEVGTPVRPLREVMHEAEREHLRRALQATGGHRSQTAVMLGISRKVLWEKLKEHGIELPEKDQVQP
jgi:DNA-binding NtrC family response regulator